MQNLNELAKEIHAGNVERGFYELQPTLKTQLMLVITELSEAVEADREGKYANVALFLEYTELGKKQPFTIPRTWHEHFNDYIKDSFEDEMADAFIRLLDIAGNYGIKLNELNLDLVNISKSKYKCDMIFSVIETLIYAKIEGEDEMIWTCLDCIHTVCYMLKIDLDFHVTEKLKYNATRPYKHGKKY
jgi:hypothetical protein